MTETSYAGCRDLFVQFPGRDEPTLANVNLSIEKGQKVLLLGPSGSGKSTLLHVLAGLVPNLIQAMTKGETWGPGQKGVLFQDPESQFCMLTVDEEIAFSLENKQVPREEMQAVIDRVKEQVGLGHLSGDTPIHSLSGGMSQRLAFATILALDPEILFLDEPTAQLDPAGTAEVIGMIKELDEDQTVILIEHKLEGILDWMDRVILFNDQGELIADGSPLEIYTECEHLIEEYGIWKPRLWPLDWESVEELPETIETRGVMKAPEGKPLIEIDCGTLRLGKKQVWTDVNATISEGDWVVIAGPNGAGKSSFLRTMMGLHELEAGILSYEFLGGTLKKRVKTEQLSHRMGFVFQNPEHQFVTDSVEAEIAFAGKVEGWPEEETAVRVEELLQEFRLAHIRNANPYTLSTGQKRRLSVASMLLKDHDVLLLDEPTFGQDAKMADELIGRIRSLNEEGTTVIMTTHDIELAYLHATKLMVLAEEGLLFAGDPEEFFANEELVKRAHLQLPLYLEYEKRTIENKLDKKAVVL